MTKGGVMIGSTVRTRSTRFSGKFVRVAMSAKARPSAVVPMPTRVARKSVFQATPQRKVEVRQSRPQIERSANFAKKTPGAKAPASSRTALARIVATGKKTKMAISATTRPIDETTKASPRHQPRAASPWQSSIRKARAVRAAPTPMPACRGPGAPNRAASQEAFQPLRPMAKPWPATSASPAAPAATSHCPVLSRSSGPISGRAAHRSGTSIGSSHSARAVRAIPKALPVCPTG
jgi:hypothetical protein